MATNFLVVDFEGTTPRGARPEPIDVAVIRMRLLDGTWAAVGRFTSLIRPPPHAPVTPSDTARTGITPSMVAQAPLAANVLARVDAELGDRSPCLLVAHHAHTEAGIIHDYRHACPRMAHTDLLDTLLLARAVYPDLPSHSLDSMIDHLGIPRPTDRHRAMPDVELTVAVFCQLLAEADRSHIWSSLVEVCKAGGIKAKANRPEQGDLLSLMQPD